MNEEHVSVASAVYTRRETDLHVASLYKEVLTLKESNNQIREKLGTIDFTKLKEDVEQIHSIISSFKIMLIVAKWCAGIATALAAVAGAIIAIKVGVTAVLFKG